MGMEMMVDLLPLRISPTTPVKISMPMDLPRLVIHLQVGQHQLDDQ
jgi:hypothetical protein